MSVARRDILRRFAFAGTATVLALTVTAALSAGGSDADPAAGRHADQTALAPFGSFVGGWKGVGQLRRGSTKGAWIEESDWAWHFDGPHAALVFETPKNKYYTAGRLEPLAEEGRFRLLATRRDDGKQDEFLGGRHGDALVVEADLAGDDFPDRISIRHAAGDARLIVLYERRIGTTDRFVRLAEVGATREGVKLAAGTGQPECIVTGGLGTIAVSYQGKTYYVCCGGCRDLFNEDPAAAIAEYEARRKEKNER